jgi:hypothetical protein
MAMGILAIHQIVFVSGARINALQLAVETICPSLTRPRINTTSRGM